MTQRERSRLCGWIGGLLVCAAAFGCASRGAATRLQGGLAQTDEQVRLLRQEVAAVDSLLRLQGREMRRQWIDLATQSEESQRQLQQTRVRLDEIAHRLAGMADRAETMRVYGGVSPAAAVAAAAPPAVAADSLAAGSGMVEDAESLYDQALADMKKGDYALAAGEFGRFQESFPQSDLADNAGYWLGECHYARQDFARAAEAFEQVAKSYPEGDKVPAALLKLGYALPEIKQRKKGVQYLNELLQRFPDSEEATAARTRLKALGAPVPKAAKTGR